MKVHHAAAVFCSATAIAAGAVLLPISGTAGAATTVHTLKFTAIAQRQAQLNKRTFAQDEIDRNKAGRIIGFDVINGIFDSATHTARGHVAFSTRGGIIYGALRFSNSPVTTGRVTGGTGRYRGITGTIYGKNLNKAGTRTAVTLTYHH